jgi:hypothetical protein
MRGLVRQSRGRMLLPFSERAKKWEPLALELRHIAKLNGHDQLNPWELAPEIALKVLDGHAILRCLPAEVQAHLIGAGKNNWSGGVYPHPLPNGDLVCILNPFQSPRRQKITLMEEISHIYLDHTPSGVACTVSGVEVREYHKDQEAEAYGVGAAALLPWHSFFKAIDAGKTIEALAELHNVAPELIEYRVKVTGASNLYKSRQRRQKSS